MVRRSGIGGFEGAGSSIRGRAGLGTQRFASWSVETPRDPGGIPGLSRGGAVKRSHAPNAGPPVGRRGGCLTACRAEQSWGRPPRTAPSHRHRACGSCRSWMVKAHSGIGGFEQAPRPKHHYRMRHGQGPRPRLQRKTAGACSKPQIPLCALIIQDLDDMDRLGRDAPLCTLA